MHEIEHRPGVANNTTNMLIFKDFFTSLLILSLSLALCVAAPAEAETKKQRRAVPSFLEFQPDPVDYQPELKNLVSSVRNLGTGKVEPSAAQAVLSELGSRRASSSRGYHDELWFLEGLVYERTSKLDSALAAYTKSIELDSRRPEAVFRKAVVLEKMQRYEPASETIREYFWLSKFNHHEARLVLARCLCKINQCEAGLKEAETALEKNPRFVPALEFVVAQKQEMLSAIQDPLKKVELSAQITADQTRLARIAPSNRGAALGHARQALDHADPLLHADKLIEAESIAKKYVDSSDFKDEEAVRLLFDIYVRKGETASAATVLERGLPKNPTSARLLEAKRQLEIQSEVDALAEEETLAKDAATKPQ
jgi:tetratricopeptide (TPR) repeat protein